MAKRSTFKEAPVTVGVKVPKIDETTVPAIKKTIAKLAKTMKPSAVAKSVHSTAKAKPVPAATWAKLNTAPTAEIADQLQSAFDHFNAELFRGNLGPCVLKLDRLRKYHGYFHPKQWSQDRKAGCLDGSTHEIRLDPDRLRNEGDKFVLSTLAHEMAHQLIFDETFKATGKIKRPYHCKDWCEGMRMIGLPSVIVDKNGNPNGKPTGANATHEIEKGGEFDKSADALLKRGFKLSWLYVPKPEKKEGKGKSKAGVKVKYECGGCDAAVWGKPELKIQCEPCEETMVPAKPAKKKGAGK